MYYLHTMEHDGKFVLAKAEAWMELVPNEMRPTCPKLSTNEPFFTEKEGHLTRQRPVGWGAPSQGALGTTVFVRPF